MEADDLRNDLLHPFTILADRENPPVGLLEGGSPFRLLTVQHSHALRQLGEFDLHAHLAFAVGEFEAHLRHRQAGDGRPVRLGA